MRLFAIALLIVVLPAIAEVTEYPATMHSRGTLTLYSTTDTTAFEPVIRDFQSLHPGIAIRYELLDTAPLYERFLRETRDGNPQADLLMSSAMDLQVKLVNDGYAMPHVSENSRALPGWARWRDEAFGFTFEPAVIVYNRRMLRGADVPRSRNQLIHLIKNNPEWMRGRVGTYDISHSSVGYLLASQDTRQSSEFGALLEVLGDANVRIEENTATLLDMLEKGELIVGYNLLGSYAQARVGIGSPLAIVQPEDYTLVMSRTAVIPRNAPHPEFAHLFLEYLLSLRGQRVLATRTNFAAVRPEAQLVQPGGSAMSDEKIGSLRPIALGPGLLVYLDRQKRQRLLSSWRSMINSPPELPAAAP